MILECGPKDNLLTVEVTLSTTPETIGVLISGGLDSAAVYFLLEQENQRLGNIHEIIPFTVSRKEGSRYFARPVIEQVQRFFGVPLVPPLEVGDNTLYEPQQVFSGAKDVINSGCSKVYLGMIVQMPEFTLGWPIYRLVETPTYKMPLLHVTKAHVVDILNKSGQQALFHLTHSCDSGTGLGRCGQCNGCRERQWGFDQMGLEDPGRV